MKRKLENLTAEDIANSNVKRKRLDLNAITKAYTIHERAIDYRNPGTVEDLLLHRVPSVVRLNSKKLAFNIFTIDILCEIFLSNFIPDSVSYSEPSKMRKLFSSTVVWGLLGSVTSYFTIILPVATYLKENLATFRTIENKEHIDAFMSEPKTSLAGKVGFYGALLFDTLKNVVSSDKPILEQNTLKMQCYNLYNELIKNDKMCIYNSCDSGSPLDCRNRYFLGHEYKTILQEYANLITDIGDAIKDIPSFPQNVLLQEQENVGNQLINDLNNPLARWRFAIKKIYGVADEMGLIATLLWTRLRKPQQRIWLSKIVRYQIYSLYTEYSNLTVQQHLQIKENSKYWTSVKSCFVAMLCVELEEFTDFIQQCVLPLDNLSVETQIQNYIWSEIQRDAATVIPQEVLTPWTPAETNEAPTEFVLNMGT